MRRKQYNDYRFLSPMGNRLAELGLNVTDVSPGRYVQIDLSKDRSQEPEEFAMYGEFDTFTVLNPQDISNLDVLLYINNNRPQSAMPLRFISHLDTIADRFFLQHSPAPGKTLHLILGGDMRAMNVTPTNQGAFQILNLDATELKIENVIQGAGADGDPSAWTVKGTVNQGAAGTTPWRVQGTINQGQAGAEPWPITGTIDGSVNVANTLTQKGSVIVDSYSDTGDKTITLPTPAHGLALVNDADDSNLNFTVNGKTFIVNAYESFDGIFKPFTTVDITASGPWRLIIKE